MNRFEESQSNRFDIQLWQRFWTIAKPYWFSEQKWQARAWLTVLLILSLSVSGLNVLISYVSRFFQTALADKDVPTFWRFLLIYAGVFVVGTPIVVIYRYIQDKLGLKWRKWLTIHFFDRYLQNRVYYQLNSNDAIDNPDQRIAQDINSFTTSSLSFLLLLLGSIIDLVSFTYILWSISITLTVVLVVYAVFGTVVTVWFGKRLIGLNFERLRREADFRYSLVRLRDNAESIAFYGGEEQESTLVKQRFAEVLRNFNLLIGWQRNLSFFTTGFQYFVVILPALVVAPIYFAGQTDFGSISQANFAFGQVLGALSIIVSQFDNLSAFAAGINRLAAFQEALETSKTGTTAIEYRFDSRLDLENVTIKTPNDQHILVRDLSLMVKPGEGLLIVGQSGTGKSSILRAIAGLWNAGEGLIVRPPSEQILFLPQRPYAVLGSLRKQLLYPNSFGDIADDQLYHVLEQVNLGDLPEKVGGLDTELDWADLLSLGEQQRLAFARLLLTQPRYAILDEATSALDLKNEELLYQQLQGVSAVFVSVGHRSSLVKYHQNVLELQGNSSWQLFSANNFSQKLGSFG